MGERLDKVRGMVDAHEADLEGIKESTKQYDDQINQYELEDKRKALHIERLIEEREAYAKEDRVLSEEYNKSIENTKKEQEELTSKKEELEAKKKVTEKEVKEKLESFTRHDEILRQLTQEEMGIDTEIMEVQLAMQTNLYKQHTFKLEYDQDGNPTNGMDLSNLDKEYKDLTDKLKDLKDAKALCQEYIQKYHDELDNEAKRKFSELEPISPEPTSPEPTSPEPTKTEPPKQEPPKQELPKQEPPKQDPPKQEPPKQEPPKQEPPKQEPPKQEPPKQEPPKQEPPKPVDIKTFAEKVYERMSPEARNDIYMFMTGQAKEMGGDAKRKFDKIEEVYGSDRKNKIESIIKQLSVRDCLKVTEIKTDVTTGLITVNFNSGEKFKPVKIDLRTFTNSGKPRMESIKKAKEELNYSRLNFDETLILDPYAMNALEQATVEEFSRLGINSNEVRLEDIQRQVDIYQGALYSYLDDEKLDINIAYVKSNEDKPIRVGRKKFEKVLRPIMRDAKESPYVKIDKSIDIRTGKEKIKDALTMPWRLLTGQAKLLQRGDYKGRYEKSPNHDKEDEPVEVTASNEELERVGRTLGPNAQINLVKNVSTGTWNEELTPEQEKMVNEMLRESAEKKANSLNSNKSEKAPDKDTSDRDDR